MRRAENGTLGTLFQNSPMHVCLRMCVCAPAVVPGVGDPGVSGLPNGGVTVITNVKHNENNEDFDGWEYSFKHYPTAEAVN
jgi:hypothetical protein